MMKVLKTWDTDKFRGEAILAELDQEVHVENYDDELFVSHFIAVSTIDNPLKDIDSAFSGGWNKETMIFLVDRAGNVMTYSEVACYRDEVDNPRSALDLWVSEQNNRSVLSV